MEKSDWLVAIGRIAPLVTAAFCLGVEVPAVTTISARLEPGSRPPGEGKIPVTMIS